MVQRYFLFDWDGTLVDSTPLHAWAFGQTLASAAPYCLAAFDYELLKGLSTRTAFAKLGIEDSGQLQWCIAQKQRLYREAVAAGRLKEHAGARALLHTVLEHSGHNFLVSSSSADSVNLALDQLDLRVFFNGTITADDVLAGKPSPESYLACLRRFGLSSPAAIAVEDARSGVVAAKGAGLRVIGVHNPGILDVADFYFPNLVALDSALRERDQRFWCDPL
ncbi:MAG: HAD-IA family hydrolase [Candidatus Binataceae bacterium]